MDTPASAESVVSPLRPKSAEANSEATLLIIFTSPAAITIPLPIFKAPNSPALEFA